MRRSSATIVETASSARLRSTPACEKSEPGLDVLAVLGADVVGEPAPLAHLGEEARRHAAAEHGGEHRGGVAVGVQQRQSVAADADVERVRFLVVDAHRADAASGLPRLGRGALGGGQRAEQLLDRARARQSVDGAAEADHGARRHVPARRGGS